MIFHKEEIVIMQKLVPGSFIKILLIAFLLFSACACTYQGDEFTFSAPIGFETTLHEPPQGNPIDDSEQVLFSKNGRLVFWVFRQNIPQASDLETVFNEYKAQPGGISDHYQFISQSVIQIQDRTAIEYIYREFSGEPYWQRREVWMENNGRAYALVCSEPADATPGLSIPVSEQCITLVDGFRFK
jgi:hypothetical protein